MSEKEIRENISDDDLKLLGKSILLYSNTGEIDDNFNDFLNLLEPHFGEETPIASINLITLEIINRFSK